MTFATKSDDRFTVKTPKAWMTTENFTLSLIASNFNDNDWIVLNNQQVGYYRVDYSTELWHAIIKQLTENYQVIHPINRAILQDEIYMGYNDFNRLNITDLLETLRYFSLEDEPLAWNRADKFLSEMNIRLLGTHAHRNFRKLVKDITKPHLDRLELEAIEGEPSSYSSLRSSVKKWNCIVWDEDCLNNEYQKWWTFYSTNISGESFNFCFALTNLDIATFSEILIGITNDVNYPSRNNYLRYLGCNQNTTNLNALLHSVIDMNNVLTNEERINLLKSVFQAGYKGTQAYFYFLDVYFAEVKAIDPDEYGKTMLELAPYISSECSIITLVFMQTHSVMFGLITRDESNAISEATSVAVAWNARNFEIVQNWFDYTYNDPVTTSTTSSTTSFETISTVT